MIKKQPLKLVHITNIPTPYRIYFFNKLNLILKDKDINLIVIYCALSEPNRNWEINKSAINYNFHILKGITINLKFMFLHINPFIYNFLNKVKPDILFNAGSWNMPSALISLFIKNRTSCIKIFWSEGHKKSVLNPNGLIAFFRRKVMRSYDFFAVPNKNSRDFLIEEKVANKFQMINLPNTIQEEYFVNNKNPFKNNKFKILTIIAALEKRKGYKYLLDALEILPINIKNLFHIEIVGEGEQSNLIKKSLKDFKISHKFWGNLKTKDVASLLSRSHGFILPSLIDPNPLSAIEALASGLPLLLSKNCGNYKECIKERKNGWSFNPLDKYDVAKKITFWAETNFEELKEMGIISKSLYDDYFSINKVCNDFASKIYKICN